MLSIEVLLLLHDVSERVQQLRHDIDAMAGALTDDERRRFAVALENIDRHRARLAATLARREH